MKTPSNGSIETQETPTSTVITAGCPQAGELPDSPRWLLVESAFKKCFMTLQYKKQQNIGKPSLEIYGKI